MEKLKILVVVGTRPEIIRLSQIIKQLDIDFNLVLVNSMQNYNHELNQVFFEDLGLREPDYVLKLGRFNTIETISKILTGVDRILETENPDAFLVLGDTNSCLSVLSAKKRKIPIFHLEAGNRCFDERVPEEINRRLIDHISDVNFTYSEISRDYLIREGCDPFFIVKLGSPMKEVMKAQENKIMGSSVISKLKLSKQEYIVMSIHRDENVSDELTLKNICEIIDYIYNELNIQIVLTLHPKTSDMLKKYKLNLNPNILQVTPLNYSDYMNLQLNSLIVISDSGSINEESSILKFTALNLRQSHERPESSEEAITILSGLEKSYVIQVINLLISQKNQRVEIKPVLEYEIDNVSIKVSRNIMSFIHKVRGKYST